MTPYEKHKKDWANCTRCILHERRKQVVLVRGKLPAEILLIGEAPGASENVIGKPFVGPAGKLLQKIIDVTIGDKHSYCFTNLVGCIPYNENRKKIPEPSKESIAACLPRVEEVMELCRKKLRLVVLVGKLASKHGPTGDQWATIEITHPAALLRLDVSQQGLAIQRCVITLEDAVRRLA